MTPYLPTLDMNESNLSISLAQPSDIGGSDQAWRQHLGQLGSLPLELLQDILQLLDIRTLTLIQSLNHQAEFLVQSLPQYREIATHAPGALRAILSTGIAPRFTILELSRELRAQECFLCGSFAGHLHLLECRRCCVPCLAEVFDTFPTDMDSVTVALELPEDVNRQFPCMELWMTTLPETHCFDYCNRSVYAQGSTHNGRGTNLGGIQEAMQACRSEYVVRTPQLLAVGCPTVRFPTLDRSTGTVEWGLSCRLCRFGPSMYYRPRDCGAMYTKRGLLAHLEHCAWFQYLRNASGRGRQKSLNTKGKGPA